VPPYAPAPGNGGANPYSQQEEAGDNRHPVHIQLELCL
jgi:hypothetical protein